MSTSVNIGDDVKSYLSSSSTGNGASSSVASTIGRMLQGNQVKGWFYSPLNTDSGDDANGSVNGDLSDSQAGGPSRSGSTASFLPAWVPGSTNPQSQESSWLPSLVSSLDYSFNKSLGILRIIYSIMYHIV